MTAVGSPEEHQRLTAVEACALMDTPRDAAFDSIVFTAAQLFRVPMAMLAIVGRDRVWLKASVGPLPQQVAISDTLCATTIWESDMLVVEDTTLDARFGGISVVAKAPNIRFYAGVPLRTAASVPIATLCVLDRMPRTVPDRARAQLRQLAREAEQLLRLIRHDPLDL